jgi:hypothetical protein
MAQENGCSGHTFWFCVLRLGTAEEESGDLTYYLSLHCVFTMFAQSL